MTNRRDMIDEALMRPGRLEVQMEIGLPDENGRVQILNIHTKRMKEYKKIADDVDSKVCTLIIPWIVWRLPTDRVVLCDEYHWFRRVKWLILLVIFLADHNVISKSFEFKMDTFTSFNFLLTGTRSPNKELLWRWIRRFSSRRSVHRNEPFDQSV